MKLLNLLSKHKVIFYFSNNFNKTTPLKYLLPYFLGLLYVCSNPIACLAQFQFWDTGSGLSNEWISTITQDKEGFMWIATQNGLCRFDGYSYKNFHYEPNNLKGLTANWIREMQQDSAGLLWLGLFLEGVALFDPKKQEVVSYALTEDSTAVTNVKKIFIASDQSIWCGSSEGLFVKRHTHTRFKKLLNDQVIFDIVEDNEGTIYIATNEAIYKLSKKDSKPIILINSENERIRRLLINQQGDLWALGQSDLYRMETVNGSNELKVYPLGENSTSSKYFLESPIFENHLGQLIIGGTKGLIFISNDETNVKHVAYETIYPKGEKPGKASCFFEDQHHNLWIGTTKGLLLQSPISARFDVPYQIPHLDQFEEVRELLELDEFFWLSNPKGLFRIHKTDPNQAPLKILEQQIFSLLASADGFVYAGSEKGIYRINRKTLVFTFHKRPKSSSGMIWSMVEDRAGKIWIGSTGPLHRFDTNTMVYDYATAGINPELDNVSIQDLLLDSDGHLWAGSLRNGLYLIKNPHEMNALDNLTYHHFEYNSNTENSLSNKIVIYLEEGKDGAIWIGTDCGLNRLDKSDYSIRRYLRKDGLLDEKIMGLVVDDYGNLWGSTIGHGIFNLDTKTNQFSFFNERDGLTENNYLLSAVLKSKDGQLFFGSDGKVQQIDPTNIKQINQPLITTLFTNLKVAKGTDVNKNDFQIINDQLELPFNYQAFSVDFTTLNYYQAEKTNYYFQLETWHNDWQANGNQRTISFTGLPPGTYTLRAKATNPDLNFLTKEQRLKITIHPPWWQTYWAYTLFALLGLAFIYAMYSYQLKRKLEQAEANRLQELDLLKTRLYTNITHELRTPLTIILGVANQLKEHQQLEIQRKANQLARNGEELLNLINQMLDLSKLEAGKLSIELIHGDLVVYLSYIIESLESLAISNGIQLHFLQEVPELWMDYDAEKIKQITHNLLTNAIKNTPNQGHIYVQIRRKEDQAELLFRDTGAGIAEEHIPYIFDRFYQTENKEGSTGIGLSLTKELVQLLNGKIQVESQLQKGTQFQLLLPINKDSNIPLAKNEVVTQPILIDEEKLVILSNGHNEETPLILLIEDNKDVLKFLTECLQNEYRLVWAEDGLIGIEQALQNIPDLIISDVMMPLKDGFEVCQTVKTDFRTNHIPIILLTAKADMKSKIEGLAYGADAYLAKPFDQKELAVRIKNLLALRKQLQTKYQDPKLWDTKTTLTAEDEFVVKVRTLIEQNISDAGFGIPQLCRSLGISRVHLHRKLKALTDQSTSIFIRKIRLHQAKKLLQSTSSNVSEVAYEVGFTDPAYFSRLYSEYFAEAPSVTRK